MGYDHATELAASQPPIDKLRFLVSELKKWADLNPDLRTLHTEFVMVERELRGTPPPEPGHD